MKSDGEAIIKEPATKESKPRRIYITRADMSRDKYGPTPGCKGCEAINRGLHGQHDERCRARIEKVIQEKDPGRFDRVIAKLVQMSDSAISQGEAGKDGPEGKRRKTEQSSSSTDARM